MCQVTRFKCGGVALGAGVQHNLSDGVSSLHFINTWSDITRDLSVAIPPFIDRTLLRAREPPTLVFEHIEYHPPPTLKNHDLKSSPKGSSTAMLKFTPEHLSQLKTKCKSEGSSTYKILAANKIVHCHRWSFEVEPSTPTRLLRQCCFHCHTSC